MSIVNHRQAGESFLAYRDRRRFVNKVIKSALLGRYATGYVPGPHPSHKPHEVKIEGMTLSDKGVPTPHTWRVLHPGTLIRKAVLK